MVMFYGFDCLKNKLFNFLYLMRMFARNLIWVQFTVLKNKDLELVKWMSGWRHLFPSRKTCVGLTKPACCKRRTNMVKSPPWEKLGVTMYSCNPAWGGRGQRFSWSKCNWWTPNLVRYPSQKIGGYQLRKTLPVDSITRFTMWAPMCTQTHRTWNM